MTSHPTTSTASVDLSSWDGHISVEKLEIANILCSRNVRLEDSLVEHCNGSDNAGCLETDQSYRGMLTNDLKITEIDIGSLNNSSGPNSDNENIVKDSPFSKRYRSVSGMTDLNNSRTLMGSCLIDDSMTEIVIEDLQNNEHEPTSAILAYCKKNFLQPYVAMLALIGLSPVNTETSAFKTCMCSLHVLVISFLLIFGYTWQYLCSYRRDSGFGSHNETMEILNMPEHKRLVHSMGVLVFGFIIPSSLHFIGFISAVIICKIIEHEEALNLIERVFLMSMKPKRLCFTLWSYISVAFLIVLLHEAHTVPTVMMQSEIFENRRIAATFKDWEAESKALLSIILLIQNTIQVIILSGYCIECNLLTVHMETLSYKLLMNSIHFLDWMREMLELHKLLDRLNNRVSIPVCFLIVYNLTCCISGFIYLFKIFDTHYSAVLLLNFLNVFLLLLMGLVPFYFAATLTRTCQNAQANGHQIRVRPFVYSNASVDELNSTLLFASSLEMSAKLFRMPIQSNYLCFGILLVSMVIITIGMCFNITSLANS